MRFILQAIRLPLAGIRLLAAGAATFWRAVRLAHDIENLAGLNAAQLAARNLRAATLVHDCYQRWEKSEPKLSVERNVIMPDQTTSWDLTPLILDFVEWVAREPRAYAEVMEAWRTSCPRLTVWEDCIEKGLVERMFENGQGMTIAPTGAGLALLRDHGRFVPGELARYQQAAE